MFTNIKNIFRRKKDIITIRRGSMLPEEVLDLEEKTGKVAVFVDDPDDIKVIEKDNDTLGDGKAEFLGEGTQEEFLEMEREKKGLKHIFGIGL